MGAEAAPERMGDRGRIGKVQVAWPLGTAAARALPDNWAMIWESHH
ncbi:MAG: hypothetical protein AAF722_15970 [Cyanobacteria bacterium P01_C01_bin.70]